MKNTYLTPKQVSEMTGYAYTTVIKYANLGILPASKIVNGKKSKYLFPVKELEKKIEDSRIRII